jgi:glycosyltransferase involved in cell wall biosynthesis
MPGKREAAVVLVANRRTQSALPGGLRGRILELAENAVDLAVWTPSKSTPEPILRGGRQRFVFIGRLVDWKALDLAIEAIARVEAATLDILGDGPMRDSWQQTAHRLGVADRVTFHGWKTQTECAGLLLHATALVLPSLFECGGAVVLEAMATSRPVIATAWGGPLDYLDDTCGILVAPSSRDALIAGFAEAMRRLLDSAELCARMGAAGRARLERHFDWNSKIDAMLEIYRSTL